MYRLTVQTSSSFGLMLKMSKKGIWSSKLQPYASVYQNVFYMQNCVIVIHLGDGTVYLSTDCD